MQADTQDRENFQKRDAQIKALRREGQEWLHGKALSADVALNSENTEDTFTRLHGRYF